MKEYAAIMEQAESGSWSAYVPDLPGCMTAGETLEELQRLLPEAIEFHLEGLRLEGFPVPEPSTKVATVRVA